MRRRPEGNPEAAFSTVLGHAIQSRGLPLDRLSLKLRDMGTPVSVATLSYWQTGRSLPKRESSLRVLENLERLLDVPTGELMSAVSADPQAVWAPMSVLRPEEKMQSALEHLGLDLNRHMSTVTAQESVVVSADGLHQEQTIRQLVRAEEEGLVHLPGVFSQAVDGDGDGPPLLEAGAGCQVGGLVAMEEERMVVAEFVLPRPLHRGDLAMFDYTVHWISTGAPEPSFVRNSFSACQFLVMEASFLGQPPSTAWMSFTERTDSPPDNAAQTTLHPGPHVQFARQDAPAGVYELCWAPA